MQVYSEYTKVYGPYTRKDGRQIVILRKGVGDQITVSYPKYLVECALDRYLSADETVDHIDEDITNNSLSNLRIVPRDLHCASHVSKRKFQQHQCPICGKWYTVTHDRKKTCGSKQCAGLSCHLNGFNKGNSLSDHSDDPVVYEDQRSCLNRYLSVQAQLDSVK